MTDTITDRFEGVRDCPATGLAIPHAHFVCDFEAAGGGPAARAQEALVEGEEGRRAVRIGKSLLINNHNSSSFRSYY